ncbi:MAG: polysaccharide biosynthesis protein, partial [Candidatus Omnitrophica bacterium]|nr:polysaccharide biosynthesis protein [Candidatus Omnitrophota bacterium]
TGAGGSIGAELCRQIMGYGPRQLVLIDSSEYNLYAVDAELQEAYGPGRHAAVLANIQSQKTMDGIFAAYRPEIVFHAAAYKHVPLMEENAPEAVKNNIWGTQNVAVLAAKHQAERFVLISTDKAVNPVNLMGASKRVAEMVVQSMTGRSQTVFSSVRFGNVLDSRGSVLPLFKKQIAQGGPVTVTHPEVVRYFMTIPEAVQLVLTAGAMARGGETFVLEMGKPVKILDMAKSLIRLSGLVPYKDIDIKIIGLRPGEKLYEELLTAGKGIQETLSERIFVDALEARDHESLFESVEALWQLANANDVQGILTRLQELVPEFHPKALAVSAASGPEDLLAL